MMNDGEEQEVTTPHLTAGVQQQLAAIIFRQNDWLAPVGTFVAALILLQVGGQTMNPVALWVWFSIATANSVATIVGNRSPALHRRIDRTGTPIAANAFGLSGGVIFAAFLWIDIDALADSRLLLSIFCVLLAISAGAVGGIAGISGIGRYVLYPIWVSGSTALFFHGEPLLAAGAVFFVLVMLKDLSETKDLLAEIVYLREVSDQRASLAESEAFRDPLTDLLNRSGLEAATQVSGFGSDGPATAMFVDLDHFKSVNDQFGHPTGDQVLIEAGRRLVGTVRPDDIVARLGGDEFAIIIAQPLDREALTRISNAIIAAMEAPFVVGGIGASISASVGVATAAAGTFDLETILCQADHALYAAKEQGRRRSVQFDETVRNDVEERSELEAALRPAVNNGEIDAWGQPIVDLETGELRIVELLARWARNDGTYCPPDIFVPMAEEIGLGAALAHRMIDQAAEVLVDWRSRPGLQSVSVSVNMSPRQLTAPGIVERIESLMAERAVPAGRLILEVTNSAKLDTVDNIDSILTRFVESGVRLAVDDFGRGYTAVQHLLGLPIEYVKIDGAMVSELGQDPRQDALIRSLRDLATTIGRHVVAEGVETQAQADTLRTMNFRLAQGYHFGRPKPLGQITAAPAVTAAAAVRP